MGTRIETPSMLVDRKGFTFVGCSPTLSWVGLHRWLRDSTQEDYIIPNNHEIGFLNEQDAVLFKLTYGQRNE